MRWLLAVALLLAANAAEAKVSFKNKVNPSLPNPIRQVMGFPTSLATIGPWYVLGVPWCGASTIIVSVAIKRRELKRSEAYSMVASCVLPVVGGLIMKRVFQQHPEWDVYTAEERAAVYRDRLGIGSQS